MPAVGPTFEILSSIVEGENGTLFIAEQGNFVVWEVADGLLRAVVGVPGVDGYAGDDGPGEQAWMSGGVTSGVPTNRLALDGRTLYIADGCNHVVRAFDLDTGTIREVAGNPGPRTIFPNCYPSIGVSDGAYSGDGGPATEAELNLPTDVATCNGVVYIADTNNHCIRRVGPDGIISAMAGTCTVPGYEGDGGQATEAKLYLPGAVACGLDGDILIADTNNQVIRRVVRPEEVEALP